MSEYSDEELMSIYREASRELTIEGRDMEGITAGIRAVFDAGRASA